MTHPFAVSRDTRTENSARLGLFGDDAPPPLRFGVMLSSTTLRAWQSDAIRPLMDIDGVEPALLIIDRREAKSRAPLERIKRIMASDHLIWDLYNNGWVARAARSLRAVDMSPEFAELPRIEVEVEKRGFSEYFSDANVAAIRAHDLDFILRFGFGIIRGPILEAARHGVWSFHHDDEDLYRGSPPAFWEVVDDQPVTGAILQRLTDRLDGGIVLDKGWFPTSRHSYTQNTDRVHFGGSDWPARAVQQIRQSGSVTTARPSTSSAPIYRRPTNTQAARFLLTQAGRFITAQVRGLTLADHWEIGVVDAPIHRFLNPAFEPEVEWQRMADPGVAYAADPFVLIDDEGPLMLFERFSSGRRSGEIWQVRPGAPSSARPAGLPTSVHASYPFCLQHDGRTYCVPQVADDGVPLFELVEGRWIHTCDLLPGERLLDPTIVAHGGRWWLFGTRPGSDSLTKLYLWFASDIVGPWTPHRLNPVKTDVRSARPAGTPFMHEGTLYRPAQDCSSGYGKGVAICEITRLDESGFEERVVRVVRPGADWPFNRGLHTLSAAGPTTVLDARRSVFDRHETIAELRGRLSRVTNRFARPHRGHAETDQPDSVNSGRLRVLAVIDALGEGGTERSLAEMLPVLREQQIDVTIAILGSRGEEGVEYMLRALGFDIRTLPAGRDRRRAFRALISEIQPDLIHSMLFKSNMVARFGSIGTGIPVVTSLVNTAYSAERLATADTNRRKVRVVQAVDALTGRLFVTRFHAVSVSVSEHAEKHLGVARDQITVVTRGRIDPRGHVPDAARADLRRELGIPENDLIIVSIGRQEPAKDHPTLIAAMAPILEEGDSVWLLIVGRDGNDSPAIERALAKVSNRDRVKLLGHRGDVAHLLAASDVCVLTSRHEGLPGAVIEASAAGLPIVASDIGPVHEVVEADHSALIAIPGDASSFEEAIRTLLANPAERERFGARSREIYEERFTIEASTENMARMYRSVARSGAG